MKKILKKIGALALAGVMVMGLSVTAFGAETLDSKGIKGDDTGTALNKSVTIYKELTGFNPAGSTVQAPNITWEYSIASGAADVTITDKDGVIAKTKAGVGSPTITSSVSWTSAETIATAADGNHDNQKALTVDFSGVTFGAAGVYRYVITEKLADGFTYANTGVTDGTITATRYLDVYVRDAQTGETGRQIYGYVLFQDVPAEHTANSASDSDVTAAVKTTGFVADTASDGSTALTADSYYTYNVTISKDLVNDSAMNEHQFPFTVTFANSNITKNIDIIGTVADTGTATAADVADGSITSVTVNPTIAKGGNAVYTGIPVGTTVAVYETNDVTGSTYKSEAAITTKESGDTDAAEKVIAPTVVSETATVASTAKDTKAEADKTIAFTNTLELISPTGLALRFAPYILMFAAGIVIFVLGRRRVFD